MPSPVRLVLFDMDGVLADTEPLHLAAANRVLAAEGVVLGVAEGREFLGRTDADLFATLHARHGLRDPVDAYVARKTTEVMVGIRQALIPGAGVCELLVQLRMRGLLTAVASSSAPPLIEAVVDALGMRRAFDGLFSAALVARGKPHPDLFLYAAERLGVAPTDCLVIEDAPSGIAAARAAGMRVVAVRTPFTAGLDLSAADRVLPALTVFDWSDLDGD